MALTAAVEFVLHLLRKVKYSRIVPSGLDVAVLPRKCLFVQQQRIEYLRVVADVPQGFVLRRNLGSGDTGRRWALQP